MKVVSVNQMQETQNQGIKQQTSAMDGQTVTNFADIIALLMQMNGGEGSPDNLPDSLLESLTGESVETEEPSDKGDLVPANETALLFSLGGMDAVLQQLQQTVLPDELPELISQNIKPPSTFSASIASQTMIPLASGTEDSPQIDFSDILEVNYQPGSPNGSEHGSAHGSADATTVPISQSNSTYQALGEAVSSIRSVKQSLQKDTTNFSDLMQAVDGAAVKSAFDGTQPAAPLRPTEKAVQIPREEQMLTQLETGIRENLEVGKREFTMKLKPESLGEITVRLTEDADKMTLHIVTASHKTAGLINDELSALRQVMAPLQVEVHEAKTVPVDPTASSQSGTFSSMDQNFTGQHFSGGGFSQQQQQNSHYASTAYQETIEDAAVLAPELSDDDSLDTYI